MTRLRKSEINVIADSMIFQTLQCFDLYALEDVKNISDEQKEKIIELIKLKANRYVNNYCDKSYTPDLINEVIKMRV